MSSPNPSWRKPVGAIAIVLLIMLWAWLVITVMDLIPGLPVGVVLLIYAIAGIAWIFPARPILVWMETGRFGGPPAT